MEILLCGVPGTGKTHAARYLEEQGLVDHVPSGERKKEILREIGVHKSLSVMNQTESLLINALFYNEPLNVKQEGERSYDWHHLPLLIDTHATYVLPDGSFVKLIPRNYKPRGIILLEASPKTVVERRIARGRNKDFTKVGIAKDELEYERMFVESYAERKQIPLLGVDNTHDWQYDKLVNFVQALRGE